MAFSYVVTAYGPEQSLHGRLVLKAGTWNSAGVTTGTIVTGLTTIVSYGLVNNTTGGTLRASQSAGSIVLNAVTSGDVGDWWAIGYA
jgi:hypothetical protein